MWRRLAHSQTSCPGSWSVCVTVSCHSVVFLWMVWGPVYPEWPCAHILPRPFSGSLLCFSCVWFISWRSVCFKHWGRNFQRTCCWIRKRNTSFYGAVLHLCMSPFWHLTFKMFHLWEKELHRLWRNAPWKVRSCYNSSWGEHEWKYWPKYQWKPICRDISVWGKVDGCHSCELILKIRLKSLKQVLLGKNLTKRSKGHGGNHLIRFWSLVRPWHSEWRGRVSLCESQRGRAEMWLSPGPGQTLQPGSQRSWPRYCSMEEYHFWSPMFAVRAQTVGRESGGMGSGRDVKTVEL